MEPKLSRCQGSNLLNHLNQKNIDVEIEQYQYLSPRDLEVEHERGNIRGGNQVNLFNNPEYYARIKFSEREFKLDYIHKNNKDYLIFLCGELDYYFKVKTVYCFEYSQKSSLEQAISLMDSHIRSSLSYNIFFNYLTLFFIIFFILLL